MTPQPPDKAFEVTPSVDSDLIARALRKVVAKEELTDRERAVLRRHERDREERLRWQYYGSIPQKHWRKMSGRQTKVLQEQATRYQIPFDRAKIDLQVVVRRLHDFLAENASRLCREPDELLRGNSSPALERYREERAKLAKLDRLERERSLIPRELARESLGRLATILRQAGEALKRQCGPLAHEILDEALEEFATEIDRGPFTDKVPHEE